MGKKREVREMQEKAMRENGLIVGNRSGLGASGEPKRTPTELTDDQVLRYLSERGFAILSVETVKELLRQSERALEGYEVNRPRQTGAAASPAQGAPAPPPSQPDTLRERLEGIVARIPHVEKIRHRSGRQCEAHCWKCELEAALLASAPTLASPGVGEPGRTLKDQLIDGLCVCVEEPLTLPIHGHLDACPGIRAWLIVEAEFKRTTTAAPPAQGAPTPQAAQEWTPVPLGKLAEEWDRLENYYTQLADAAQGAGYDKGSFQGKAIGISICAAQLRKALAQPGAPAKEER